MRRDGARPGDDVWVSGRLGGAALGLRHLLGETRLPAGESGDCLIRLHAPEPRVALGRALLGVATGAIDLSDGFVADLGHILERSGVGAEILFEQMPAHPAVASRLDEAWARRCLLGGGDDYELCFTAPAEKAREVLAAGESAGVGVTWVGRITQAPGLRILGPDARPMPVELRGYDHFA